jgi:hypothetical protein
MTNIQKVINLFEEEKQNSQKFLTKRQRKIRMNDFVKTNLKSRYVCLDYLDLNFEKWESAYLYFLRAAVRNRNDKKSQAIYKIRVVHNTLYFLLSFMKIRFNKDYFLKHVDDYLKNMNIT